MSVENPCPISRTDYHDVVRRNLGSRFGKYFPNEGATPAGKMISMVMKVEYPEHTCTECSKPCDFIDWEVGSEKDFETDKGTTEKVICRRGKFWCESHGVRTSRWANYCKLEHKLVFVAEPDERQGVVLELYDCPYCKFQVPVIVPADSEHRYSAPW